MLTVLDLFSGIGGFSLGLERTGGFKTVAFCEIDPFARRVLAKHWPEVPCYDDVRTLDAARLDADGIGRVDVICGGFPCQDISVAGKGAGLEGERSGLWSEIRRLAGELRPRFVLVENVSALLGRGLDRVLGDLAEIGFDAEWHCIPASAVGAPHRRDRIWIVADADSQRELQQKGRKLNQRRRPGYGSAFVADTDAGDEHGRRSNVQMGWGRFASQVADDGFTGGAQWRSEPNVGRVAHGIPNRVDRLGALGNAVVPQIPELIGRAILAGEAA
jgi:DNA (cytosine-5)-methyltransferase 1